MLNNEEPSPTREIFSNIWKDLTCRESWKLKAVYFFLLSGIVILWAQLTTHQATLGLSDRDIADFAAIGSILGMVLPFLAGFIADKIGNYSFLVSVLMILMGVNSFFFLLIPPIVADEIPWKSSCSFVEIMKNLSSSISTSSKDHLQLMQNLFIAYNKTILPSFVALEDQLYSISALQDVLKSCLLASSNDNIANNSVVCDQFRPITNSAIDLVTNFTSLVDNDCLGNSTTDSNSYSKTYWSYLVVRTTFMMITSSCFVLYDSVVMAISRKKNVDYGLQRAWGTLAALISSYAGGALVDYYSVGKATKDFTLMFFGSGVCCIMAGIFMFQVDIGFKLPATNYTRDILKDLKSFEAISLLLVIVFKGCFMGYAETFMYLFMFKLGANASMIGLTITVGAAFDILLQIFATPITKSLGKIYVIAIGLLCYSARFVGFSYATHPETILGLEVLDSWGSGLANTVTNLYLAVLASPCTIASMRGLAGALDGGIGKYIGTKAGIEIKEYFGDRIAWRIMAVWAAIIAVIYAVSLKIFKLYQRRRKSSSVTIENSYTNCGFESSVI